MNKTITFLKSSIPLSLSNGFTKMLKAIVPIALLTLIITAGCRKDEFEGEVVGVCPTVTSDPMDKAVDVALGKVITITFNTDMDSTTINDQTFSVMQGTTLVPGKVSATANTKIFTFTPTVALLPFTVYSGTVTTGTKDRFKTAMAEKYTWSFTTIPLITLAATPAEGGTVTGAGVFAQGASTTVAAIPNTGYVFTNWTEAGVAVSTSSVYTFPIAGNRTLIANFAPLVPGQLGVVLSSNPIAGGTNRGSGAYTAGTTVQIETTPNEGYIFVNWTEGGVPVSANPVYQFIIATNRTLVANYIAGPSSDFVLALSSAPTAGGQTTGARAYKRAETANINAIPNTGYTFRDWTENGVVISTSAAYTFPMNSNRSLVANFTINTYTLIVNSVNGVVAVSPMQATYNYGTQVNLTATPNAGYKFSTWSGDANGTVNAITVVMTSNRNITANYVASAPAGQVGINLGTAADFATLTKSGISTTGITTITGNIGVSPAAATAITGFGLIMDTDGTSSHTPIVTGKVYASDYAAPTPAKMTTAVSDMETAFNTGNALVTPAPINELYQGDISGRILASGLYKWSTGVLITNEGVTLNGGPDDIWVFQIAQNLTVNNSAIIKLTGGAQAKNIFWVVSGQATLGANTDFSGIILSKTLISLNTGAKVTGRLLAQTAVTLNSATVIQP